MPRESTSTSPPVTWLEADLGDTEFRVLEHSDGMFTVDVPADRLVMNAEQMRPIAEAFARLATAKGWIAEGSGS